MDHSDWGTAPGWYKFGERPSEESCSRLHPNQTISFPHSSTRAGARHPLLLLPGLGTSTPSPLGPRRWLRFTPTNLWRSAAGSTGAPHWQLPLERNKARARKAMELGERPGGLDTRCSLHTIGDPNICRDWHTSSLHCSPSLQACRSAEPSLLIGND